MKRILAMTAVACVAASVPQAFGGNGESEPGWAAENAAPAQEENRFYEMRALGRAESRLTGTTMDGNADPQALIERNRELGRAEARWIPEDLGGKVVDRQAIGSGMTRGEACSPVQLKRDC